MTHNGPPPLVDPTGAVEPGMQITIIGGKAHGQVFDVLAYDAQGRVAKVKRVRWYTRLWRWFKRLWRRR